MKRIISTFLIAACATVAHAQVITYTDSMQWKAYDDFNEVFLDKSKYIYRDYSDRPVAVDRWGGAAAIWCQAIYFDMVVNAYRRAEAEGDKARMSKYKTLFTRIFNGEKSQYVNFNFDDCNTNTGWFVYDDIMWWTGALARAYEVFGNNIYLTYSEKSFCRTWYGSAKVGDDGSYADPARFSGKYGGGMFWEWQPIDKPKPHKEGDFRSACINFPTVIAACHLHQLVPEGRTPPTAVRPTRQTKEWYLEKAIEVYDWASSTLVNTSGRVADGIHGGGPEFKDHLYNQATYIGASCMLYKITGETKYRTNAIRGANYVFTTMSSTNGGYLPLEKGVEQGIYAAIFAQYISMLVYDLEQTRFLTYIKKNLQKAWDNRDTERGISNGNFRQKTTSTEQVESYTASGMPALMLMFPVGDSSTGVKSASAKAEKDLSDVYSLDGKLLMKDVTIDQVNSLDSGLYIYQKRKYVVK